MVLYIYIYENSARYDLQNKAPRAELSETGWIRDNVFLKWFLKFCEFLNVSNENPVLLVLGGHATHIKNLEVIEMAEDKGVILLCTLPHCTHKLQPHDVSFNKPLNTYYNAELNKFMRENPKCVDNVKEINGLFGKTYIKACTMENGVNRFRETGIFTFN